MKHPHYILAEDDATTDRQPWRCEKCRNLLAKLYLGPGSDIELKCPYCNSWNTILVSKSDEEMRVNHLSTAPLHAARSVGI